MNFIFQVLTSITPPEREPSVTVVALPAWVRGPPPALLAAAVCGALPGIQQVINTVAEKNLLLLRSSDYF